MKQGKHSAHCLAYSKHLLRDSNVTMIIIITSTRECGKQTVQASGRGILLLMFHNVPAPLKPPNSSCFGLQASRQDLFKPDRCRPAAAPGAGEEDKKGVGAGDRRREVEVCLPTQEHSPWIPPRSCRVAPALTQPCFLTSHMVSISECNRQLLAAGSSY